MLTSSATLNTRVYTRLNASAPVYAAPGHTATLPNTLTLTPYKNKGKFNLRVDRQRTEANSVAGLPPVSGYIRITVNYDDATEFTDAEILADLADAKAFIDAFIADIRAGHS